MRSSSKDVGLALVAFVAGFLLAFAVFASTADAKAEVCPEEGKVESTVDGDLDDIVLDAGTEVCIFGASVQVNVTADGESTLRDLLGLDKNVSHYTITEVPPSTTTTTPETSTTTTPEETTTTEPPSESTTTSVTSESTSTSTTTTEPSTTSSSTTPTTTEKSGATTTTVTSPVLPSTGAESLVGLSLLAAALLGGGITLLRRDE